MFQLQEIFNALCMWLWTKYERRHVMRCIVYIKYAVDWVICLELIELLPCNVSVLIEECGLERNRFSMKFDRCGVSNRNEERQPHETKRTFSLDFQNIPPSTIRECIIISIVIPANQLSSIVIQTILNNAYLALYDVWIGNANTLCDQFTYENSHPHVPHTEYCKIGYVTITPYQLLLHQSRIIIPASTQHMLT